MGGAAPGLRASLNSLPARRIQPTGARSISPTAWMQPMIALLAVS